MRGNLEPTVGGEASLVATLTILHVDHREIRTLEGNHWFGGRDETAEIPLPDSRISRRHFELMRTDEGFFLTDMGSANGTRLNGERLSPHEPVRIASGDWIEVQGTEIVFEIRNTELPDRILELSQAPQYPSATTATGLVMAAQRAESPKSKNLGRNVRIAASALALATVSVTAWLCWPKHAPIRKVDPTITAVRDSFIMSRNLYINGKYELCLAQLAIVHEIAHGPYENSKELQEYCEQGKELVLRMRALEEDEEKARVLNARIDAIVSVCKENTAAQVSTTRMNECLKEAKDLNPGHPLVTELLSKVEDREREVSLIAEGKAKTAAREAEARRRMRESRRLASLKRETDQKVSIFIDLCKSMSEKNRLKDAYSACGEALNLDPHNEAADALIGPIFETLHRQFKSIYEESVLEESLGSIDSAIDKWKRIVSEDVDSDEYTKKAKVLLKKYGFESNRSQTMRGST